MGKRVMTRRNPLKLQNENIFLDQIIDITGMVLYYLLLSFVRIIFFLPFVIAYCLIYVNDRIYYEEFWERISLVKVASNKAYKTNGVLGKPNIIKPVRYKILTATSLLFSAKTQKEVFLPIMSDWDEEIYETLKKDKDAKLFMINLRNIYAFLSAVWQKSPIGDLIEFVRKIAN